MTINVKFCNMLESKIADVGGISAAALTVNLTTGDGAKIPTLGVSGYIYAYFKDVAGNWELVKFSSVTGDACTIASTADRGLGGSSAQAWDADDIVHFAPCAEELEDIIADVNQNETDVATNAAAIAAINAKSFISAYKSSNQTIAALGTAKILFQEETSDTNAEFAGSTLTAKYAGEYIVKGTLEVEPANTDVTARYLLHIYKNGVSFKRFTARSPGYSFSIPIDGLVPVAIGNTIDIYLYSGNGATVNNGQTITNVDIYRR